MGHCGCPPSGSTKSKPTSYQPETNPRATRNLFYDTHQPPSQPRSNTSPSSRPRITASAEEKESCLKTRRSRLGIQPRCLVGSRLFYGLLGRDFGPPMSVLRNRTNSGAWAASLPIGQLPAGHFSRKCTRASASNCFPVPTCATPSARVLLISRRALFLCSASRSKTCSSVFAGCLTRSCCSLS